MSEKLYLALSALGISPKADILDEKFPHQTNFIKDSARLKALFCTRRASKSYTGGLGLFEASLDLAGCNCLFIGLTRLSAKGIIWKDVYKDINKRHNLNAQFNETELTATLPNGSIIYTTGVDADESEMEKLLGKKYKRIVIDEAASYTIDLRRLVYGVLKPTVVDQDGDIWLMGTSGNLTKGLFFDITNNKEPGWKLFTWSALDNPYVADQWAKELEDIRLNRPLFMETPLFKQWYLNQWVIDSSKLVYKFSREKNLYDTLPYYPHGDWSYVLGVDLGYDDASAFVVVAFHEHDKTLYILESFSQTKMDITDVAQRIKFYQSRYNIFKVVVDGANKQAVKEMQNRHEIALTAADKTGKSDFIEIMNAEFIQAKIKLQAQENIGLVDEYLNLIWDERKLESTGRREEHPNCENHRCDAALYAWRFCYQWLSRAPDIKKNLNVFRDRSEWIRHSESLLEENLNKQIASEQAAISEQEFFNTSGLDSNESVLSYYINKKKGLA